MTSDQTSSDAHPTDAEIATYVAETCADLVRLAERKPLERVRDLLGRARQEAEKLRTAEDE